MKKYLVLLLFLSIAYSLKAQDKVKQKELGIVFNNFNNFGLTYRVGNNKAMWRINTVLLSGNNKTTASDSLSSKESSFGLGIAMGREYRKEVAENFELRFGADLFFNHTQSAKEEDDKSSNNTDSEINKSSYEQGIKIVFGINYIVKNNLVFGVEALSGVSYITGTNNSKYDNPINVVEKKRAFSGFNYGLSNTTVLLSLTYRF